ncbi:hypothetical protein EJB05_48428, partial [Eragrostis curvula]
MSLTSASMSSTTSSSHSSTTEGSSAGAAGTLPLAWQLWEDGLWLQFVDASLVTEFHTLEMMRCIIIALLCVQENAADRPTMSDVVAFLSSDRIPLPEPNHPAYLE